MKEMIVFPGSAKEIVEKLREKFNLSQQLIAREIGVGERTIQNLLQGKTVSDNTEFKLMLLYIRKMIAK